MEQGDALILMALEQRKNNFERIYQIRTPTHAHWLSFLAEIDSKENVFLIPNLHYFVSMSVFNARNDHEL